MTPKRVYYGLIAIIVLLIAALFGGAYGINSLLATQSHKLVALKAQVASLNLEQSNLVKAKKDITKYTKLYNIARVVVPENKDQAEAVRQIVNLASSNNVNLASITFPASSLGGSGLLPASAGTVPVAAPPESSAQAKLSQLVAVPDIPGVYDLQISVASSTDLTKLTTYPQLIGFLQALEQNRLTALVSAMSITPNAINHNLFSFTLTLAVYIKPGT